MDTDAHRLNALTEKVIGAAFEISNLLGAGFLEKVYERAFLRELTLRGIRAKSQVPYKACYKGHYIGEYVADLVIEDQLVVELKCVERLTNDPLALLINFEHPKLDWKRILLDDAHRRPSADPNSIL